MEVIELGKLIAAIHPVKIYGSINRKVMGITPDSRKVREGFVFVSIPGYQFDGHNFIQDSLRRGAIAVVQERAPLPWGKATFIQVKNSRLALAKLSAQFYSYPSRRLGVIGVTGTNGKTTTTYLIESLLHCAGYKVGCLGTIQYRWGDRIFPAKNTTPESTDLQFFLHNMSQKGIDYAVLEVSSHSLVQHRVEEIDFDCAVFTNLTQDHLDYHRDLNNYFQAKKILFDKLSASSKEKKFAIINFDDPYGRKLLSEIKGCKIITYGLDSRSDIRAIVPDYSWEGIYFRVNCDYGEEEIHLPLLGRYNIYNALAAVGVGLSLGISWPDIKEGLRMVKQVPGRFDLTPGTNGFRIAIDYAHTPEALKNLLLSAREISQGRLITVFGCGGNRDKDKRPKMGRISTTLSDLTIITSDNPRQEDPEEIISDIVKGVRKGGKGKYTIIPDRYQAIMKALSLARRGDLVIIAGKGHEDYQVLKDTVVPFNDKEIAKKILSQINHN